MTNGSDHGGAPSQEQGASLESRLSGLASGLLVPSEIDAPLEFYRWDTSRGAFSPEMLAASEGAAAVQMQEASEFFAGLEREEDWHTPEERAVKQRFRALREALEAHLSNIRVYRLGSPEVRVFVLGIAPDGSSVGFRTRLLET